MVIVSDPYLCILNKSMNYNYLINMSCILIVILQPCGVAVEFTFKLHIYLLLNTAFGKFQEKRTNKVRINLNVLGREIKYSPQTTQSICQL